MNYIDTKYISLISVRLRNFSKKSDYLWNFSCPYCGDSQKNRKKARGFIYKTKNDLFYKCHNCAMGTTLPKLIEHIDSNLYKEYQMEMFKEGKAGKEYNGSFKVKEPEFTFKKPVFKSFLGLKKFSELEKNHPAMKIFSKRCLPRASWNDIYYCPKFFEFTNTLVKNKFPTLDGDHPRMIIPFRNEAGEIFAYQGRAFGSEPQKYITIILDGDCPKIFGMDKVELSKPIYVTEGPLDSLFIDNGIAVAQSDLRIPHLKDKIILVPDNEPRNKSITDQISRFIDDGYKIVIWPNAVKQKDINDMILHGYTHDEIMLIISSNTHHGLSAKTVFNNWKKN
jgi:transcription elongation factor Elf1